VEKKHFEYTFVSSTELVCIETKPVQEEREEGGNATGWVRSIA